MKSFPLLLLAMATLCPIAIVAQDLSIEADPVAVVMSSNNVMLEVPDTIREGSSNTELDNTVTSKTAAPIIVEFLSNVTSDKTNLRYEWTFSYDSQCEASFLSRYDENTDYTFTSAGTVYVQLRISDEESGSEYYSIPFSITVSESMLELPNAFSPNGDGINDRYTVRHQSLVSFEAHIFNRWGQELYSWSIGNIDDGWDGTYKGKTVSNGVYFIVVVAEGADGIEYKKKSSINVMTGISDGYNNGTYNQ